MYDKKDTTHRIYRVTLKALRYLQGKLREKKAQLLQRQPRQVSLEQSIHQRVATASRKPSQMDKK